MADFEVREWDDEEPTIAVRGWDEPDEANLGTAMQRGIGGLKQGGNALSLGANQRSLDVMDRIDRGEQVREVDDPVGYQHMDAGQRKAIREQTRKLLGENVADVARHAQAIDTIPEAPSVKRLKEAKSFGEAWDAFKADPVRIIGHIGAESFPQMATGLIGATIAGPVAGAPAAAAAMGAGSYSSEYASGILQSLQEMGVDLRNPATLRAAVSDPELMRQVREKAASKASIVGTLDAASGGVASRSLIPGKIAATAAGKAGNLAVQAPVQGAMGAGGEVLGSLATGEQIKPGAVAAEFFGEFAGAPAEVATMAASHAKPRPVAPPVEVLAAPTVDDAIAAAEAALATEPASTPLALPHYAGPPLVAFPDGSVMTGREADDYRFAPQPADEPQAAVSIPAPVEPTLDTPAAAVPAVPAIPDRPQLPPRDVTGMTMPELTLAMRLTRSEERKAQLAAEIERRAALESSTIAPNLSTAVADSLTSVANPLPSSTSVDVSPQGAPDARAVESQPAPVGSEPAPAAQAEEAGRPEAAQQYQAPEQRAEESVAPEATKAEDTNFTTASWVIREKATGNVVMETDQRSVAEKVNTEKYEAVPIQEYLAGVNKTIREKGYETVNATVADVSKSVQAAPQFDDFEAGKEGVKTFKSEKQALAFQKQQGKRVGKAYTPRMLEDGRWALSKPAAAPVAPRKPVTARSTDSAKQIIHKSGGWNWADAAKDGVDPAERRSQPGFFRANGGLTIDGIAEVLDSHGFDVRDEYGAIDATKAREIMEQSFSGPVYSPEGQEAQRAKEKPVDQRQDADYRKRVSEMSPEEMRRELMVDNLTGLGNRRAWEETRRDSPKPVVASVDADNLKWINDSLGHQAGDDLLRAIGKAMADEGIEGFHISGDEFVAHFNDEESAYEQMGRVKARLRDATITAIKGDQRITKTGVDFSYGLGKDIAEAETGLQRDKADREDAGHRVARGAEPPGVAREPAVQTGQDRSDPPAERVAFARAKSPVGQGQIQYEAPPPADLFSQPEPKAPASAGVSTSEAPSPMAAAATALRSAAEAIERSVAKKGEIADFGEKIGGAKKDTYQRQMEAAKDVDILAEPLSKSWPAPDYQAMLDAGFDPWAVAFMHAARDEIPAKPRKPWAVKQWAEQVKMLRNLSMGLADTKSQYFQHITAKRAKESLAEFAAKSRGMENLQSRIELYEAVGHAKSLDGVRVAFHEYSLYGGVKYDPPRAIWVVEKDQAATAFSNWPRELATGRTKAEAIAEFKAKYDSLDINPPASKEVSFDIFSKRGENGYWIGKKVGRNPILLVGPFATIKEARTYKSEKNADLVAKLEKAKEVPNERRETNEPRVGADMRNGQDVTAEMFGETFGFRGVEFGNWVEQGKRQRDLNDAFDALMDMAAILGVPPKAISLNGELGLAFGARGSGGINPAAAHYERDFVVINLTKKSGAGSIGHEWWHALDNYFSRMRGNKNDYLTEALDVSLASRGSNYVAQGAVRKEMIDAFGQVVRAIKETAMKARSSRLDARRSKEYWTTGREMAARAYESYLISKLQDQNASNDYLANIVDEATWKAAESMGFELDDSYPYPTAGEVPKIRAGFEHFFATIQSKETEKGVALFNRQSDEAETGKQSGLSVAEVREIAAAVSGAWSNPPEQIKVIATIAEAPPSVREEAAVTKDAQAEGVPYAFYYERENTIYLIASEIRSPEQAVTGLLHEGLGHYGLRGVFGDKLSGLLGQLASARQADVAAKAKEYGLDILKRDDRLLAAEEVLAELAQSRPEISFVRKAIAIIRTWLRETFPSLKIAMSDDEIINNFIIPARNFVERGNSKSAISKGTTFHRAYHGTPHDFDRFSTEHIGSGEGAQAYGWGMYFAGKREVAEHYRNRLATTPTIKIDGKPIYDGGEANFRAHGRLVNRLNVNSTPKDVGRMAALLAAEARRERDRGANDPTHLQREDAIADRLDEIGDAARAGRVTMQRGRLFEVELTPKESEYIDWDKPIKDQSESVKAALRESGIARDVDTISTAAGQYFRVSGGISKDVAQQLSEAGIPGVRYLDGASRTRSLRDLKREFLKELPEDAGTDEVSELIGTGRFSPTNDAILKALKDDDWLGFDYPAQAISAALGGNLSNFDASKALVDAVAAAQEEGTHNYVIFDDKHVEVKAKFARTKPGNRASWDAPEPSKIDKAIYTLQDRHIDTKRVLQAVRATGKDVADQADVYLQEELYHGKAAKRTDDFINRELKPLLTDMAARGISMQEFEEYLHARHAEEANKHIASINPEMPDGGSGMDTADAKAYLAKLDDRRKRAFEALAAKVDKITAETRQMLVDDGLESKATVAGWAKAFKHYVPLNREDMGGTPGIGQGFSVRGPASKKRTGSKREVVDILANIALQRERAIVRGDKNRVSNALVGLAIANPNPDFWKADDPPKIKVVGTDGQVKEQVDPNYKGKDTVVVSRMPDEKGEIVEHFVAFNERNERAVRMALALKNLDTDQLGIVLGTASKITRYFASVNTQYNPVFGIVNLERDVGAAMANLSSTPLAGKQRAVFGYTLSALRGIYIDIRAARKGEEARSKWAELWEEFQNEGGRTGYRDMFTDSKERAKALEREIKRATEGKVKQNVRAVFDWLSDYNTTMENAVRLAAYKVGKEEGLTNARAASLAKNLTVNFNRKGQITTQAGALYAFFNANVQGSARLMETLKGPAGKKIILGGLVLGSMQAVLLAAAGFDDEEPPEFEREKNLIVPTGKKTYIKIPMPLGLHIIPNIGRLSTEFALGGFKNAGKKAGDLIGVMFDAFNPVGSSSGLSMGSVAQLLSPTAVDPITSLAVNQDWTGRPIAKVDRNSSHPTPGHTRGKDTSTQVAKWMAEGVNWATGGTQFKPGKVSPTPDQIDFLIGQVTGGVGREISKAEQTVASFVTGEKLPENKMLLVSRFYGNADSPGAKSHRFYENIRELNEHQAEIEGRRKAQQPIQDYVRDNPEAMLYRYGDQMERTVGQLNKRKRELVAKDAPREQIERIEQRIEEAMTRFNDRIKQAKKPRDAQARTQQTGP